MNLGAVRSSPKCCWSYDKAECDQLHDAEETGRFIYMSDIKETPTLRFSAPRNLPRLFHSAALLELSYLYCAALWHLRIETLAIPPVLFGYSRLPFCLKIYGVLGDLFAAPRTPYSFSIIGTLMNCTRFCPLHYGVLLIHFSVPMDETINQCCHIVRLRVRFHRLCKSEESSHWFRKQPYRSLSVLWYQPIRPHNDMSFRPDPKILPNCLF